jgi:hypothetical protein
LRRGFNWDCDWDCDWNCDWDWDWDWDWDLDWDCDLDLYLFKLITFVLFFFEKLLSLNFIKFNKPLFSIS